MKRFIGFSTVLLTLTCSISFVPKISSVNARETVSKKCINGLLYQSIYADGTPKSHRKTHIDNVTAATICSGIANLAQVEQTRVCVMGVIYESVDYNDGTPQSNKRTNLSIETASDLCTVNRKNLDTVYRD